MGKRSFKLTTSAAPIADNGSVRLLADLQEAGAREGVVDVLRIWPRRTHRSANGFQIERRGLETRVRNEVPYSGYVHRRGATGAEAKHGIDESVLPELLRQAIRDTLADRGEEVAVAFMAEALREVKRGN